jgi:hypothetical protein
LVKPLLNVSELKRDEAEINLTCPVVGFTTITLSVVLEPGCNPVMAKKLAADVAIVVG